MIIAMIISVLWSLAHIALVACICFVIIAAVVALLQTIKEVIAENCEDIKHPWLWTFGIVIGCIVGLYLIITMIPIVIAMLIMSSPIFIAIHLYKRFKLCMKEKDKKDPYKK